MSYKKVKNLKKLILIILLVIIILFVILFSGYITDEKTNNQEYKLIFSGNWEKQYDFINNKDDLLNDIVNSFPSQNNIDTLEYKGTKYNCSYCVIDSSFVGNNCIDSVKLKNQTIEITSQIYSISDISINCAIAVKFDKDNNYYIYRNSEYKPQTLHQLLNDINLKDNSELNSLWFNYVDSVGLYKYIEFKNVNRNIVLDYLLYKDNYDLSDYIIKQEDNKLMEICFDVYPLGYKDITFVLYDNGYITTNILDSNKAFYFGKEKVFNFVQYIIDNYEGKEITFVYDDSHLDDNCCEDD